MYRFPKFAPSSAALLLARGGHPRGIREFWSAAASPDPPVLGPGDRETLRRYARDTWRSFEAMAQPGGLPADGLRRGGDGAWKPTEKTSPTDIAAYLWSTLAAEKLQIIGSDEARRRLDRTLAALARLERVHGFFFDWFDPRTGVTLSTSAARRQTDPPVGLGGGQRLAGGRPDHGAQHPAGACASGPMGS